MLLSPAFVSRSPQAKTQLKSEVPRSWIGLVSLPPAMRAHLHRLASAPHASSGLCTARLVWPLHRTPRLASAPHASSGPHRTPRFVVVSRTSSETLPVSRWNSVKQRPVSPMHLVACPPLSSSHASPTHPRCHRHPRPLDREPCHPTTTAIRRRLLLRPFISPSAVSVRRIRSPACDVASPRLLPGGAVKLHRLSEKTSPPALPAGPPRLLSVAEWPPASPTVEPSIDCRRPFPTVPSAGAKFHARHGTGDANFAPCPLPWAAAATAW
ncbi:hypothetical protein RJ55_00543 [Drechmeria coniospora]|nr:hypothetical protein RJ55_00543 [Drechmeria coniospora]